MGPAGGKARQKHRRQLAFGTTRNWGEQERPLEDLILDHVDWLDCSSGSELAREVEVMEALATGFWDGTRSVRLSLKEEIFEFEILLEEMWDTTGPSSSVETKASLVFAARMLKAPRQRVLQGGA